MKTDVVVIGAGPAGLTAAFLLTKKNNSVTVIEADPVYVGGIARTVKYKGYCFDIGGHRFFSKSQAVEDLWTEILPNDMLVRPRSSRIFYRNKFFSYPLKAIEVVHKLGIFESIACIFSYLKARINPVKVPKTFSEWVINHFGKRLFNMFFKTYTEKVWGMRCEEISADWAAQRIKGLSFFNAILNALPKFRRKDVTKSTVIKTLINTFRYPRKGPGMLWETCVEKIQAAGGNIVRGNYVSNCEYDAATQRWKIRSQAVSGEEKYFYAKHLISSAPLRELVLDYLQPSLSEKSLQAAQALKYRDFLIVVLILKDKKQFNDNWIYIHDPNVDVARIQNFKSWSEEMVPDPTMCCYGMEYFCFESDSFWNLSDDALLEKAKKEIVKIGLANLEDIQDGCVVRQIKAYPVYDENYKKNVDIIRQELEEKFPTLHLVGRNGMHKYNNQDHAMMTAMLTVENIIAQRKLYDIWQVNQDAEYHEAGAGGESHFGLRAVPEKVSP